MSTILGYTMVYPILGHPNKLPGTVRSFKEVGEISPVAVALHGI